MNLYVAETEIALLEGVLNRAAPGDSLIAAKVALAWHLRQRDSARALRLVQEVMPVVGAPGAALQGDAIAACHSRAALAAAEASAFYCEFDEAERCLRDARAHFAPTWDAQAEGDAWLVESIVAKGRGQRARELDALARAIAFFERSGAPGRLAIARMWAAFERTLTQTGAPEPPQPDPGPGTAVEARHAWEAIRDAARATTLSHRNPAAAAATFKRAGELAGGLGMVHLEVSCLLESGAANHELGDYDLAARCFDVAAARAHATGWPTLMGTCDTRIGELLCDLGAYDESRAILGESIDTLSACPRGTALASACSALARTLLAMGEADHSLVPMGEAIHLFREAGAARDLAVNLVLLARALAAAQRPAEVLTVLGKAAPLIDELGLEALWVNVSDVLADLHHRFPLSPPPGMTLPTPALHYAEAMLRDGLRIRGWKPRAALHAFLAERWSEAGDPTRAYEYARQALVAKEQETAQKMSYPLALLRARRRAEVRDGPLEALAAVDDGGAWDEA
jgi:tetratricopeptide (TPR) repeat protein